MSSSAPSPALWEKGENKPRREVQDAKLESARQDVDPGLAINGRTTFDPPVVFSTSTPLPRFDDWDPRLVAIARPALSDASAQLQDNWLADNAARAAGPHAVHFRPRPWLRLATGQVVMPDLDIRSAADNLKGGVIYVPPHERDRDLRLWCDGGYVRAEGHELVLKSKSALLREKHKEGRPIAGGRSLLDRIGPRVDPSSSVSTPPLPASMGLLGSASSSSSSPAPGHDFVFKALAVRIAASGRRFIAQENALRRGFQSPEEADAADAAAREQRKRDLEQRTGVVRRGRGKHSTGMLIDSENWADAVERRSRKRKRDTDADVEEPSSKSRKRRWYSVAPW